MGCEEERDCGGGELVEVCGGEGCGGGGSGEEAGGDGGEGVGWGWSFFFFFGMGGWGVRRGGGKWGMEWE